MTTKIVKTDNTVLLNECREIVVKRMRSSLNSMMEQVGSTLLDMAFKRGGNVNESPYIDAIRELHLKKTEIKTRFEKRFNVLFDECVNQTTAGKNELGVIGNYRLGENTVTDIYATNISRNCREALLLLDKRFSLIIEHQSSGIKNNPVKPEVIYASFRDACWDLESGDEIRELIYMLFEKYASNELNKIYQEINDLIQRKNDAAELSKADADKEGSNLTAYRIRSLMEQRITNHELPAFVDNFLAHEWCQYLEKIYEIRGEDSFDWEKAWQTVDDLLFIITGPEDMQHKKRITQIYPRVVYRLNSAIKVLNIPTAERTDFIKTLREWYYDRYSY